MKKAKSICFCGLFTAAFFAISNLLPPIQIIPSVPLTLQIFLISLIAFMLDFSYSVITYVTILVMTLCGIPMMSSLSSGVYTFTGPTAGYIYGWFLLICLISVGKLVSKKVKGTNKKTVIRIMFAFVGAIFVYLSGAAWIAISTSSGIDGFLSVFISSITAFLMFDTLKIIAGYAVFKFISKFI